MNLPTKIYTSHCRSNLKYNEMRKIRLLITAAFILIFFQEQYAQSMLELPYKPLNQEFINLTKTLKEIDKTDSRRYVELCNEALDKFEDRNIRFNLIYWELSFYYSDMEQYDSCLNILKQGQDEGLFYYTRTNSEGRLFPPYLKELAKLDGYESFIDKNTALKDAANQHKSLEFMVQLPTGYTKNKKYPLMLIMHGGIGNISQLQHNYISEKLQKDFIVVYTQGDNYFGSFSRAYGRDNWKAQIKDVYHKIISKYTIDTTQVILAGPSAGGYRSLLLGLNNSIPSKGLLLSFAVYPRELDSTLFIKAAEKGLKVALLCGENDWAIQQQKKLGYYFDKYGIKNRFVVFPEEGHGFPDNWPYYLDTSLDFILEED